jgi:hypothetical protein
MIQKYFRLYSLSLFWGILLSSSPVNAPKLNLPTNAWQELGTAKFHQKEKSNFFQKVVAGLKSFYFGDGFHRP